jgi:hypothetical protein
VPVDAPTEMGSAAGGEGGGEAGVGEPLREGEDQRRGRAVPGDDLGEVDAVVQEQVRVEAFAVVVDQSREAEASPAWVPSL